MADMTGSQPDGPVADSVDGYKVRGDEWDEEDDDDPPMVCKNCGASFATHSFDCPNCHEPYPDDEDIFSPADLEEEPDTCPTCGGCGEGQYEGTKCSTCHGSGQIETEGMRAEREDEEAHAFDMREEMREERHRSLNGVRNGEKKAEQGKTV